ncbi:MAG: hypothetical protein V3T05_04015, partial [Myxococcota bacterium]
MTTTDYRLPNAVLPIAYDVDLDASPRRVGFSGTLGLTVRVTEPTDSIELHARGLKVNAVTARLGKKRLKG